MTGVDRTEALGGHGPTAAVVLAGGRSSRMGTPKATLEWHGSTLLRHVTGVVGRAVDGPVIVVRAAGQPLPVLEPEVLILEDPQEGLGPMMGLAVGLAAAARYTETAFVCSTDLPFLHSAFVTAVLDGFESTPSRSSAGATPTAVGADATEIEVPPDVVLPHVGGYRQPMAAGYRTGLAPQIQRLVQAGRTRPAQLFEEVTVRQLDARSLLADTRLASVDPTLDSVLNVNTPEDYRAARARPAPEVVVSRFVGLAPVGARPGYVRVRAATLAAAAAQVGVVLDGQVVAAINSDQIRHDPTSPLLAGDVVSFVSANARSLRSLGSHLDRWPPPQ